MTHPTNHTSREAVTSHTPVSRSPLPPQSSRILTHIHTYSKYIKKPRAPLSRIFPSLSFPAPPKAGREAMDNFPTTWQMKQCSYCSYLQLAACSGDAIDLLRFRAIPRLHQQLQQIPSTCASSSNQHPAISTCTGSISRSPLTQGKRSSPARQKKKANTPSPPLLEPLTADQKLGIRKQVIHTAYQRNVNKNRHQAHMGSVSPPPK